MKYIEAPQPYTPNKNEKTLFVAGGITHCKPWQFRFVDLLKENNITVFNPRRKTYVESDKTAEEQIIWEYNLLEKADAVSFWFTSETLCPITLYELGKVSQKNKKLFVGVNPEYRRKLDVEMQMKLSRPEVKIVYSLNDLADQIKGWANN